MAKRVYLSPSDQRRNTYAVGDTTEAIQCGRIAEACKAALERSGVEVMLGQYDTMQNRVAASNRFKADLHVPIHSNACNGKASGTHLFCYSGDRNSAGYKACQAVMDVLGPITPGAPDVIRAYPALYEVKHPAATTVYIETDFHDVPRIAQWIIDNTTLIGETIAKGLCAARTLCGERKRAGAGACGEGHDAVHAGTDAQTRHEGRGCQDVAGGADRLRLFLRICRCGRRLWRRHGDGAEEVPDQVRPRR